MKTSLLLYDIPESSEFDNPSNLLRRVALRINKSCWVVDQDRTPWNLLNEMTTANVVWHLFEFAEAATENIMKVAADMLRKDLADMAKRENEALIRADAQLAEALADTTAGDKTWEAARKKHATHRESTLKRTEKVVADLEKAAEMFGLDVGSFDFNRAINRVNGIRSLQGARAASYAEMTEMAKGTSLEVAAKDGDVPEGILRDFLTDQGKDVSAAQTAFSASVATEPSRVVSSMNGEKVKGVEAPRVEKTYTVRDRHGNNRTVNSSMTDGEAAAACRDRSDNFSRDLARTFRRRPLSATQTAWMHILANESLPKPTTVVESKPAPAQKIIEDAKTIVKGWNDQGRTREEIATEFKEVLTGQASLDDLLPHEKLNNIPEISTLTMTCHGGICFGEASTIGLACFPPQLNVKSHRTGNVVLFTKNEEHMVEDELIYVEYKSNANNILRIAND